MGPALGFLAAFAIQPPSAQAETPPPQPAGRASPQAALAAGRPVTGKFAILEYDVDGNTVLSIPEIEETVYPFLGEQRDSADVDKARQALEDAYHKRGFQTVQVVIPQQSIDSGIIHLQVIENPVGRLRVVGSKYHLPSAIKALAPSLAEGKVPNINDVQKDIVALNQQPDMKVTPHLASGEAPDTVDVDLQVEDHLPVHASVEINNQYTQGTTPLRVLSTISYGNLWQAGHTISLSYQVAPENPSDAEIWSGSYVAPLAGTPLSFSFYGLHSDSNVPAVVGTNVIGHGYIFGGSAIITLPGTDTLYHSVSVGIARKDLSQNVVTNGVPSNAPVLYYPITLAYSATVQNGQATTQADASLNFAPPGTGSTSLKFDAQRYQALPTYFYAKADISRTQPLPAGAEAYGKIDGQITPDALLSASNTPPAARTACAAISKPRNSAITARTAPPSCAARRSRR